MIVPQVSAQLGFGVKAGVNFCALHWDKEEIASDNSGVGYTVGAEMEYIYAKNDLGFDLSLLLSQENYRLIYHQISGDTDVDRGNLFVTLPIHFKWMPRFIGGGKIVKPIIYTGPQFSVLLPFNKKENTEERRFKMSSPIKWNIGIGAEFINKIQVNVQYGIGLNTLLKYEHHMISKDKYEEAGHSTITVSVAWMFR